MAVLVMMTDHEFAKVATQCSYCHWMIRMLTAGQDGCVVMYDMVAALTVFDLTRISPFDLYC